MCKHGTDTLMQVFIPAGLSHTGEDRWEEKAVDSCIAPIVKALLDAGIMTIGSCCGHGKEPGSIHLLDGRVLVITKDAEEARRLSGGGGGATSHVRGHPIRWDGVAWRYTDTGEAAGAVDRPCAACRRPPTPEGYDACLGFIPGATSACCGHGVSPPSLIVG